MIVITIYFDDTIVDGVDGRPTATVVVRGARPSRLHGVGTSTLSFYEIVVPSEA